MNSADLARIIQEGIAAGMLQKSQAAAGFTPNTPFTPEVLSYPLPDRFKYPRVKEYDGTTDPINHLNIYTDIMNLQVAPDAVMCKAFPQTLTNAARDWFSTLEPNSVSSFPDLADKFSAFFASSKRIRKTAASLMQMRQGPSETLRSFMAKFNKERLMIPDLHITAAVSALTYAVRCEAFKMSLSKTPPKSITDLLTRAEKYINMEETMFPKRDAVPVKRPELKRPHESNHRPDPARSKPRQDPPPAPFTRLNTTRSNILMEIKDLKELKWPPRLRDPPEARDKSKYCDFHRDHGHTTDGCFALKREIEALIKRGFLGTYVSEEKRRRDNQNRGKAPEGGNKQPTAGTINVIVGGTASGGDSNSGRKQYARQYQSVSTVDLGAADDITFGSRDLEGVSFPHDDALVITAIIANFEVKRILVDNGSAANVLSHEAFVQMGISSEQLKPVKTPLQGFGGGIVIPEGVVGLPLTLGSEKKKVTHVTTFQVVRAPMAYNAILGRPLLNRIRAIVSTFHLALKFPTEGGIGVVRGSQSVARQCYVTSVREIKTDVMQLYEVEHDLEHRGRLAPVGEMDEVELDAGRKVTIGRDLDPATKTQLVSCLARNLDVFAWSVEDMPGIDPEVAVHRLNVTPGARPVKQRRRQFAPERREAIREEIAKLVKANFIREVHYPDWLANVVLVKKANGKWRVCIDFTDLNKACPKDSYPLPRIDSLVDSTSGHKLYSFLDAFSGYHQILMSEDDQEKTSFMADSAIYCYKVMPFGLKNAGATYQRLVNKIFAHLIGKNIEAYVDDMVVKSKQVGGHIADLEEVFATLRKYRMKLNPTKCMFGVASGKFLGFMITHRGIEANPDKIQALASMQAPTCKKDIQRLAGRVAALNRFVSRAADRCVPFFKILRGNQNFDWNEECSVAFQELKQTLSTPPVLTKPEPGDTLLLYLAVSENAVSGVLVKEAGKVQRPIYYVSKVLLDAETRYTLAEQLALALVVAARKLRQYFQSHPVIVLTNQPLRHILQKPDVSGRLLKWAVELGEFDIEFKPRPAIKAQVLADFIAELTSRPRGPADSVPTKNLETWETFVDGASNSSGSGAGVILTNPSRAVEIQCAFRFDFEATNNEAEYEAVVLALELACNLDIQHIKVFSDSQLVVGQIEGTFEKREEKMSLYCLKVHDLRRRFKDCEIIKIARTDNTKADALSRLMFMGIDGLDRTVHVKIVTEPSITQKSSIMDIDQEPSWVDPIFGYLASGNLPPDPREARSVKTRASRYCIIKGVLFRRSFTLPYLRCLRPTESLQALAEVHEGICGNHQGARALAFKLIRYGYYWPTMKKDASDYVKRCDKCQRFGNLIHTHAEELTSILYAAPFEQWGVDILGPFPLARGQVKFVAVAVEYFTKWVEAEPLAIISEPKLRSFVWKSVVCRFGIPKVLITDNGRQFDNSQFKNFCTNLGIEHRLTSVAHPQSNGLAEVTNRIILQDLKTRIGDAKGSWPEELPAILWTYRTSHKTATGETPFMLAFGVEAVIPVEIGIPTQRVIDPRSEEQTTEHLDLIEEVREQASLRAASYQNKAAKHFNTKVKTRRFRVGDLVLRKAAAAGHPPGKLGPAWEGPYEVIRKVKGGAYSLRDTSGKPLPRPWNADNLKIYYK
jgi:ribonuclease HI